MAKEPDYDKMARELDYEHLVQDFIISARCNESLRRDLKKIQLSPDDLYEIEKILDIKAGEYDDCLNRYCNTAINWDAVKKFRNPLDSRIKEIQFSISRVKEIRDKLQEIRLSTKK